jgi:folylpolyglutamate synthase/dihydropteroate synthase
MLTQLRPLAARVRCVPVRGFSHQPPERLSEIGRLLGLEAAACPSLGAALEDVAGRPEAICVTGTLYLYEATLEALGRPGPAI